MHAVELAKAAGIPTVLVPEQPGVFSALGLVMADIRHDAVQTRLARGADITPEHLQRLFDVLEEQTNTALEQDGVPASQRVFRRTADMRYVGQAYEVNVPVPDGALDAAAIEIMLRRFHDLHQQLYAHNNPEKTVEFVSGRVAAIGLMSAPPMRTKRCAAARRAPKEHRPVYFEESGGFVDTAVYDRDALGPGAKLTGPAIVEQIDTTTVVLPGQSVSVDDFGNLLISTGSERMMRVDPITFEVVQNALIGVAEQMAATILRTSYSTVIREMLDYSTAVFDAKGRIIAQSCRIPIHLNSMSRSLRTTLDGIIPIEEWNPGDIIVMNDPYLGGQHLPDIQTFLPVFENGRLIAICGTLGHHLDVGGMRPGSYAGDAVEIYQEGLRIPPIRLFDGGKINERLFSLIAANIRQPDTDDRRPALASGRAGDRPQRHARTCRPIRDRKTQ